MKVVSTEVECSSCGEDTTFYLNTKTGILHENNPANCSNCGHEFTEHELDKAHDKLIDKVVSERDHRNEDRYI